MTEETTVCANPTPTDSGIPLRSANFATLPEALAYAATGNSGFNYYDERGALSAVLPYRELHDRARDMARCLARFGRGQRLALVAHTHPDFAVMLYACMIAGLVPVPLPAAVHLGGRDAYVRHLRQLLRDCNAVAAFAPAEFIDFLREASEGESLALAGTAAEFLAQGADMSAATQPPLLPLLPSTPTELAYLQYTSGSTRFPRGTMIPQSAVMANLHAIFNSGFRLTADDRFCSWLPYYHDMGLVGIVLGCVATQRSVDFLPTRTFAMRPRLWLKLMSQNRCSVSFGPPFGYTLCARRLRPGEAEALDLSAWRIAGVGAEMIHPESLRQFAAMLAPAGFRESAFLPCYGMAECSLAVSFAPLGTGAQSDTVDVDLLSSSGEARPVAASDETFKRAALGKAFINCGVPLPGYEVEIRDEHGRVLAERHCGRVYLRGPSVMSGYFGNPEASREVLAPDGWLDTGDLGYLADGALHITGRAKDLMIIKGRNIWPQDLEHLAEQQPEVRPTDSSAFSLTDEDDSENAVLVVQSRETDPQRLAELAERLQRAIHAEFGIQCVIELVVPHTLPRTSSGKLSRSLARHEFLVRRRDDAVNRATTCFLSDGPALGSVLGSGSGSLARPALSLSAATA